MHASIAIVGMACQYPDAPSPADLWLNVLAQRQAFRRLPAERTNLEDYGDGDPSAADRTYGKEAAVIANYHFDRERFRVGGGTYRSTDLTHWLALETAERALLDSGFAGGEGLPKKNTGVFLGNTLTGEFSRSGVMRLRWPFVRRVIAKVLAEQGIAQTASLLEELEVEYKRPFPEVNEDSLAGGLSNTIAGRICNYFNLGGGGYTVDGACSSSLLAVSTGCKALVAGELDVALVGGVDLSLDPFELIGFAKAGALSKEDMRIYDSRPTGFLPGEGCGVLVLMREADALAQHRRIYATIRGWGISSDGSGGLIRPEVDGQMLALQRAYVQAGFGPDTVGYFEGHGTGTAVGDQVELTSLSQVRRQANRQASPAALGSIKANIGHTKAAAGVAGLIKATMALHQQVLPPTTGCCHPHQELRGAQAVLRILRHAEPWPADQPRRAGVSAMGFGGINTHIVLEGVDEHRELPTLLAAGRQDAELITLSAPSNEDLQAQIAHLLRYAERLSRAEVTDLAAHLSQQPVAGAFRAALVASNPTALCAGLQLLHTWLQEGIVSRLDPEAGVFLGTGDSDPRIGFLFPGQGVVARPDGGLLAERFAVIKRLYAQVALPKNPDQTATEVAQPQIVTASLAGLEALHILGIEAQVALGHSLGELVALHWSGAFDAETLVSLAAQRGQLMALPGETGAMASLSCDGSQALSLIAGTDVVVACLNGSHQTVIAGATTQVLTIVEQARRLGCAATLLKVSHAFHSPLMEPAVQPFYSILANTLLSAPKRPLVSTVTGDFLTTDTDIAALLAEQLTSPVKFQAALQLITPMVDLLIEVGPGHVLSGLVSETPVIALETGSDSVSGLLKAVGAAFALGAAIDREALFVGRFSRNFPLDWQPTFFSNPCELAPALVMSAEAPKIAREAPLAVIPAGDSAFEVVRALVASRVELPLNAIHPDHRLLSDLHLNSITVAQLVTRAAQSLGLPPLASPTDYANATVSEMAAALDALRQRGGSAERTPEPAIPAGVETWVRPFTIDWVECPRPPVRKRGQGKWQIFAAKGHPLSKALQKRFVGGGGDGGIVVLLPQNPDERQVPLLLAAAKAMLAARRGSRFVLVQEGHGGAGFAKTLHLENPKTPTAVVNVPFDHPQAADWVWIEAMAPNSSYCEASYDQQGCRREPLLNMLADAHEAEALPFGPTDILLVSGGGRGIAAECALTLARESGVRLLVLGRSQPEQVPELAKNLERFAAYGVDYRYLAVDVTDPEAVRTAIQRTEADWGVITGILHSAGQNVPQLLGALDQESFRRTLKPKISGLRHLLAAIQPEKLRLLITFGSIIARSGMEGEADYATANEWLTALTEDWQYRYPDCRCLAAEWSVWSGVGMGERLGRLAVLAQEGIDPIPPTVGVEILRQLIVHPHRPVAVVVAGRLGKLPTVQLAQPELPFLRFLERVRVHYPQIELVVEADLSVESDPYLQDHIFAGERILPAVLGIEAMAQAVSALAGTQGPPVFENLQFHRPVVVPGSGSLTIRVCVLAQPGGTYTVALRSSDTLFQVNHFSASCHFAGVLVRESSLSPFPEPLPLDPKADLYGSLLFHTGRFQRLENYRHLQGTGCIAEIAPDSAEPWFGAYLPDSFLLGSPAVRDTFIHAIQGCLPHAFLLPGGVERVTFGSGLPEGSLFVHAQERYRENHTVYVYDLAITDGTGLVVERWEGLRLQRIAPAPLPLVWPTPLIAPYLENRLRELGNTDGELMVALETDRGLEKRSERALQTRLGQAVTLMYGPDGKPELVGSLTSVTFSHCNELTLAVLGAPGCDIEVVQSLDWRALLTPERFALAELIVHECQEDQDTAATRVWAAQECAIKGGVASPFTLLSNDSNHWVQIQCASATIFTLALALQTGSKLVLAVFCSPQTSKTTVQIKEG